jgi:hypothetical protein
MTIDAETGSTASASLMAWATGDRSHGGTVRCGPPRCRLGRAGHKTHSVAALEVPDDLAGQWRLMPCRAAQLADDPLLIAGVEVDLLAGERRAPTIRTAVAGGLEGTETAAQEPALELLHVCRIGGH